MYIKFLSKIHNAYIQPKNTQFYLNKNNETK